MKVINWLMFVLALAAVAFFGYTGYQYMTFDPQTYETEAAALDAQTRQVESDTQALLSELENRENELRSDLAQAGEDGAQVQQQLQDLAGEITRRQERLEEIRQEAEFLDHMKENALAMRQEYAAKIRQLEDKIVAGESDVKICYWTLDDGPTYYTEQFLEAAKANGAYVTFFTAREANQSAANDDPAVERELLRKEILGGNSVYNHTNSHQFGPQGNLYGQGIDSFRQQVKLQDDWITECTGIKPDVFRFPGGSSYAFAHQSKDAMLEVLDDLGYVWIDWSCDLYDNAVANPSAGTAYATAIYEITTMKIAMILSHDWNYNTLEAFKRAVPELQNRGYVFLPLFSQSWTIGNTSIVFS